MQNELDLNNKEKLPTLSYTKQLALFLLGCLGVYIISFIVSVIAVSIYKTVNGLESIEDINEQLKLIMLFEGLTYGILFVSEILIINKDLLKIFKGFNKIKPYLAGIACCILIIVFEVLYLNFFNLIGHSLGNGGNQTDIDDLTSFSKPWSIIIFGIIGPICEEFTYRVGFFSFLKRKNRVLAYVFASLIFGFIHIMSQLDGDVLNEILILPIYIFAGFSFAMTYERHGLVASTFGHILNNVFSLVLCVSVNLL